MNSPSKELSAKNPPAISLPARTAPVKSLPKTVPDYLDQLREALRGADPALIQDALYDAEEYLRSALAEQPHRDETEVLAEIAGSYGAPTEVADIYRDTETQVAQALRTPAEPKRSSLLGHFFGVAVDPRTYGALFYMLLSLATGLLYFTTVSIGLSLSAGLALLIIGVPFVILFIGVVRVLSLVEGRVVEVMLGERMPRRPLYADRGRPVLERIQGMFTDPRTWLTMLYMVLMMPLGIAYFTVAVTGLSLSLTLMAAGVARVLQEMGLLVGEFQINDGLSPFWGDVAAAPIYFTAGLLLLFVLLHIARGVGQLHGALAKNLLVKSGG